MKSLNKIIKKTNNNLSKIIKTGLYGLTIGLLPLPLNNTLHSLNLDIHSPVYIQDIFYYKEVSENIKNINNIFYTNTKFQFFKEKEAQSILKKNKTQGSFFYFNDFNKTNNIYIVYNDKTSANAQYLFHLVHEYMHAQTYNRINNNFKNLNKEKMDKNTYKNKYSKKLNLLNKKTNPENYINNLLPLSYNNFLQETYADALSIAFFAKLATQSTEHYNFFKKLVRDNIVAYRAVNYLNKSHYTLKTNKIFYEYYFSDKKQKKIANQSIDTVFFDSLKFLEKHKKTYNIKDYKINLISLYNLSGDNDFNSVINKKDLVENTHSILTEANKWMNEISTSKNLTKKQKNRLFNTGIINIINYKVDNILIDDNIVGSLNEIQIRFKKMKNLKINNKTEVTSILNNLDSTKKINIIKHKDLSLSKYTTKSHTINIRKQL